MANQQPPKQDSARNTDNSASNEQAGASGPIAPAPGGQTNPEASTVHTKPHCQPYPPKEHLAVRGLALLAAVGGFFAAIFTGLQWWISWDTEITNSRAIVLSNMARLITYDPPIEGDDKNGTGPRRWLIAARIENVGNTPTRHARIAANTTVGFGTMTDDAFDKKIGGNPRNMSPVMIGPKSDIAAGGFVFSNTNLNDLSLGAAGLVKYEDIFGYPHLTEFCYTIRTPPINFHQSAAGQQIDAIGVPCAHHNCADDECGPDWKQRATE